MRRHGAALLSAPVKAMADEDEAFTYDTDVLVVGGGPAGMAAAMSVKQQLPDANVVLLEKAPEIGAHTLSGACIETRALDELLPDWASEGAPLHTQVSKDDVMLLTETGSVPLPVLPSMANHGNYIVSLGKVVRWLGEKAEEAGVDVFPGVAASHVHYEKDASGRDVVCGVVSGEVGIARDGSKKDSYEAGTIFRAKRVLFAEGCRGHLSKEVIAKYGLDNGKNPQTYGIGLKEVWEASADAPWVEGLVQHTAGYPLSADMYGGSFLYHFRDDLDRRLMSVGLVVGLDYSNPYVKPYEEFQKLKQHPAVRSHLEGSDCLAYGARALVEGGIQSLPQLAFPGGILIGDCAGFLNVPKIKGTHTAMKSGMLAADVVVEGLKSEVSNDHSEEWCNHVMRIAGTEAARMDQVFKESWLYEELYKARNFRPAFHYGLYAGSVMAAVDAVTGGRLPFTLNHAGPDYAALKKASECTPIEYPKPDGVVTFDLMTSVSRSGTNHEEDQPIHLTLKDASYVLFLVFFVDGDMVFRC